MARAKHGDGSVWVATESFTADLDGAPVTIVAGHTRVDDGHELVTRYPQFFERMEAHFKVEQATAAPGEKRSR